MKDYDPLAIAIDLLDTAVKYVSDLDIAKSTEEVEKLLRDEKRARDETLSFAIVSIAKDVRRIAEGSPYPRVPSDRVRSHARDDCAD